MNKGAHYNATMVVLVSASEVAVVGCSVEVFIGRLGVGIEPRRAVGWAV